MRFDSVRAVHYCEVFLIGGNPFTYYSGGLLQHDRPEQQGGSPQYMSRGHVGQGRCRCAENINPPAGSLSGSLRGNFHWNMQRYRQTDVDNGVFLVLGKLFDKPGFNEFASARKIYC
jgi:hypothetical protein